MRPRQLPLLFLVSSVGAGVTVSAGCENNPVHTFVASAWDPVRECLLAQDIIDVVEGADPGPCETVRCWETPAGDVYVSTTACDAPPDFVDRSNDAAGSPCANALAALAEPRCAP